MLLTGNFVFAPDVSRLKRRGYGKRAGADRERRDLPTPTRAHPRGDVWLRGHSGHIVEGSFRRLTSDRTGSRYLFPFADFSPVRSICAARSRLEDLWRSDNVKFDAVTLPPDSRSPRARRSGGKNTPSPSRSLMNPNPCPLVSSESFPSSRVALSLRLQNAHQRVDAPQIDGRASRCRPRRGSRRRGPRLPPTRGPR
jgi:hypothetical protein